MSKSTFLRKPNPLFWILDGIALGWRRKGLSRITFLEFLCAPLKEFITLIHLNPIPSGETAHPSGEAFRNDQGKNFI